MYGGNENPKGKGGADVRRWHTVWAGRPDHGIFLAHTQPIGGAIMLYAPKDVSVTKNWKQQGELAVRPGGRNGDSLRQHIAST